MRIAGPSLALSLLLLAAPAVAQTVEGTPGPDMQRSQQPTGQGRYELTPMQPGARSGSMNRQMGPMEHMGQMGQAETGGPGIVTSATRAMIKQSLEQSGFKNVTVLPQAYLIRAQAPDGSRVVMQVSPEGLRGVVVSRDEERSGGTMHDHMRGGGMPDHMRGMIRQHMMGGR